MSQFGYYRDRDLRLTFIIIKWFILKNFTHNLKVRVHIMMDQYFKNETIPIYMQF
jgi:hypothetical protein